MGFSATILGCAGTELTREEDAFFRDVQPVGFILFARNVEKPLQLARLVSDLRATAPDAPVFIDQEGGRVQRMRAPYWREWTPPLDMVEALGADASRALYLRSYIIGRELLDCGIDANCGPLADIAQADTHPVLRNRLYGDEAGQVALHARAVADGLRDAGVFPVLKHIPGHGRARLDSHHDLPRVTTDLETLRDTDFAPFQALADLPWGMTAHLVYAAIDPDLPATLSPRMIRVIRDGIGFQGLLMTDDLSMNALPGPVEERAGRARAAGCDIVLHCNGEMEEMRKVVEAAGPLDRDATDRLAAVMRARPDPVRLDIREVEAEFDALISRDR